MGLKVRYYDKAPTPEELVKIVDIADIRGKVIVSMLALGGFRIGTLVKLQYRHIKDDFEREIVTMPHRTIINPEQNEIETLNQALKQAIIKELQK